MGVASHDTYLHRESVIHRWSPRLKLVSLLVLMFAFATVRQPILIPWMLGLAAGLYLLSGLPLAFLGQRLSYPGLFVLALVVLLPLTVGDTVLGQWGWLTLRVRGYTTDCGSIFIDFDPGVYLAGHNAVFDLAAGDAIAGVAHYFGRYDPAVLPLPV